MNLVTAELKKKLGCSPRFDPTLNHGLSGIAAHLEKDFPATARKLYEVGFKIEQLELELVQMEMRSDTISRMLESMESQSPTQIFNALPESLRSKYMELDCQRRMQEFLGRKHDSDFRADILEKGERLLFGGDLITLRAIYEVSDEDYMHDFGRMFRHASALNIIHLQMISLESNLPLYKIVTDAYEVLGGVKSLDLSELERIEELPLVTGLEEGRPKIDYIEWRERAPQLPISGADAHIAKLIEVDVKNFLISVHGHANISGFNCSRLHASGIELNAKQKAALESIEHVYSMLVGE